MSEWLRACSRTSCVELSRSGDAVLIRDSKDPDGPVLAFTPAELAEFLDGVRRGVFDGLLCPPRS